MNRPAISIGKPATAESEVWADATVLAPAYRRGNTFQTAMVKLASAGSFQQFKDALTSDPRLNVRVERAGRRRRGVRLPSDRRTTPPASRETDYFAAQSRMLRLLVTGLALVVCSLMGLGALFGALNTMYTAVAARSRDIATLEAIGFSGFPVMISVIAEALMLALIGGVVGAVAAYLAFDGYRTATMNWQTFSQVAFAFDVTPALMVSAIAYALVIGLIGGLFPAIRAARLPVATALRKA
jgi:putative ABC transport system permease protein